MNFFWTLLVVAGFSAKWFPLKHVPKMAMEAIQILYTVHHIHNMPWTQGKGSLPPAKENGERGYRPYNPKMLLVRWVASSLQAYSMLLHYTGIILDEYTERTGNVSSMVDHLDWLTQNPPPLDREGMEPMPCYVLPGYIVMAETWNQVHTLYTSYISHTQASHDGRPGREAPPTRSARVAAGKQRDGPPGGRPAGSGAPQVQAH